MIPAICIDASNKPVEILLNEWLNQGATYHITHVYWHPLQGLQGVELQEVSLSERSYPFKSFKLSRFAINIADLPKLIEMIKDCSELDNVDITQLLEESKLEIIEK